MCSTGTGYKLVCRLLFFTGFWTLGRLVGRLVSIVLLDCVQTVGVSVETRSGPSHPMLGTKRLLKDCIRLRFTVVGCNDCRFLTNRWIHFVKPLDQLVTDWYKLVCMRGGQCRLIEAECYYTTWLVQWIWQQSVYRQIWTCGHDELVKSMKRGQDTLKMTLDPQPIEVCVSN